eukprot:5335398-Pyramimonas_sp.AAC.1
MYRSRRPKRLDGSGCGRAAGLQRSLVARAAWADNPFGDVRRPLGGRLRLGDARVPDGLVGLLQAGEEQRRTRCRGNCASNWP